MEPNSLLKDALSFFALGETFTHEELKRSFHELALKFHPDRGEFTSPVLFQELLRYHGILERSLKIKAASVEKISERINDPDYGIYRKAKSLENAAVLSYFKSRAGSTVRLNESSNPELSVLREKLGLARELYSNLKRQFPGSIWEKDSSDSIGRIDIWLG